MELGVFKFIDEVNSLVNDKREKLEVVSSEINRVFKEVLILNNEAYMNVTSRVKGEASLKEKILRNNYFKKYSNAHEVVENLSDLIGVRVECRFIEDERKVYKIFKKYFNMIDDSGLYYNRLNDAVRLELSGIQPQEQKNGFKIYRIDGRAFYNGIAVNFELQIKSLVNVFWGEIEHKIIYKNNNYNVWNKFFKDIMGAIKKNLSLIDNQLEIVYNQFNEMNESTEESRKVQLETMLSKMIYEIYSNKMKDSIGIVVDFRNACDTIMKYILRTRGADDIDDYKDVLVRMFSRLNDIGKNKINFDDVLLFSREAQYKDEFSKYLGEKMFEMINDDFQWNLFFRILFEIELGSNVEDFEMFIGFLEERFNHYNFEYLEINFNEEQQAIIRDEILIELCNVFGEIKSVEFVYDNVIEKINKATRKVCKNIAMNIKTMDEWNANKHIFIKLYGYKLLSLFNNKVSVTEVKELIMNIHENHNKIEVSSSVLDYLHTLDDSEEIHAGTVLKFFK